jgi:hypothetical protein
MAPDELISTELMEIMTRLANIQASITSRTLLNATRMIPILLQIEEDLETWACNLPSSWRYQILSCPPRNDFYTVYYHTYPGYSIGAAWNHYRISRCIVNDLLVTSLDSSKHLTISERRNQAKRKIVMLCTDICLSTPYFLRQMDYSSFPKPTVGSNDVMWALSVCANMRCVPEERRLWAVTQLERIGHEMGVHQALQLAKVARCSTNSDEELESAT